MKKSILVLAAALAASTVPVVAHAELSANLALTSKYKFRGQDQSNPDKAALPAIQGGFDYSTGGFYVGNWNSSIGFGGGTEMDFYGGYGGEVAGMSYDVGILQYYYPSETSLDTTEIYGSLGWGPLTAKYSHTVSSKWFGVQDGDGTGYLELNGELEVASGITLVGHLGATQFSSGAKRTGSVKNYNDYKVGVGFDLGSGFAAEAAVVGASEKAFWGDINKSRVVLTLSKAL